MSIQSTKLRILLNLLVYEVFLEHSSERFNNGSGVRVVPEFDTPGHTDSWGPGAGPKFLTPCYKNGQPDGTRGPINPIYQENYDLMRKLFTEVNQVFSDSYLHLGGDEVPFGCWKSNPDITDYMTKHNLTTYAQIEQVWVQGLLNILNILRNFKKF